MIARPLPLLLAAALIVPVLAVSAGAARKRDKRVAKPAPVARHVTPAFRHQPARMIEIAPGKWISSWGCYTDEGYGRYSSCDMREGPR
jgi:hypothetical protein